ARGAGEILLTSMDRDGTGAGYDLELVRAVASAVPIPVIASGGVGELAHLAAGLEAGADAVLAASIFHYGPHTIPAPHAFPAAPRWARRRRSSPRAGSRCGRRRDHEHRTRVGRARPGAGDRAGRDHRCGPDDGVDERGGAAAHPRDRLRALLVAIAIEDVEEG